MTYKTYHGIQLIEFLLKNLPSLLPTGFIAYLILPILVIWDEFFENNAPSASDLSPGITGMKR
jgi:hypothetical protein